MSVEGVENARLKVAQKLWFSTGSKTRAARGEKTLSSSLKCVSSRPAKTRSNWSVNAVFDWSYAPNSSMLSSASFLPLIVPWVRGFVKK